MTGDQLDYLLGFVASLVSSVQQHQLQHYFLYRIKTEKGFMALVSHSLVVVWIHVQWEERPRHPQVYKVIHPQVYKVIRHFQKEKGIGVDYSDFRMTLKNGFGVFVICFFSHWMKRSRHGLFAFPPKKTLIWRRHCSIGQSCCSMTSKRSSIDF